ncbi:MAG: hypothetical protein M1832_006356 [Thelocarpon impressellum]|nr:MAG: hypothetical protein M1832_006356 [Thelocarpon impressellum]
MAVPNEPNTITGLQIANLREKEELCMQMQAEYDSILDYLQKAEQKGATLQQLAQTSSNGLKARDRRRTGGAMDKASEQRHAAENSLERAQQEKRELEALFAT